jgi:hypothetical protein
MINSDYQQPWLLMYEGYSESNIPVSGQQNKNTKNTYVLKLLLNLVTAGTEALVSRNKFLYACAKKVCRLWAQPHFQQLLIIAEALWSQPVLQVGK